MSESVSVYHRLRCIRCGTAPTSLEEIKRSATGRETVVAVCAECGRVNYWYVAHTPTPEYLLFDIIDKPQGVKRWPPPGWKRRHG